MWPFSYNSHLAPLDKQRWFMALYLLDLHGVTYLLHIKTVRNSKVAS